MDINYYCPVTGHTITRKEDWSRQVSKQFKTDFSVIGDAVSYSSPEGYADHEGVEKSLWQNRFVTDYILNKYKTFIQIEDYGRMEGSSPSGRKIFIRWMNENRYLSDLIFCNTTPSLAIAVKIGIRFNYSGKRIHIVKNYEEAVTLAFHLLKKYVICPELSETGQIIQGLNSEETLQPVEVISDEALLINSDTFTSSSLILNREILHTTVDGFITAGDTEKLGDMRNNARRLAGEGHTIRYIVADAEKQSGIDRKARRLYMQAMKDWNKNETLRIYVLYNSNRFLETILSLGKPFFPFLVKAVPDKQQAFKLIQSDIKKRGHGSSEGIRRNPVSPEQEYVDDFLKYLGAINWDSEGMDAPGIDREHPYLVVFDAIKLVKEELDNLICEHRSVEDNLQEALEDKKNLLKELQHRVKNSFNMINSILWLKKESGVSEETSAALSDIRGKVGAIAEMYELLNDSDSFQKTFLNVYLMKLVSNYKVTSPDIDFISHFETLTVSTETAITLGLIISELITNSIKHAFSGITTRRIEISLKQNPDKSCSLVYQDNGNGLSGMGLNPARPKASQGFLLIAELIKQLKAEYSMANSGSFSCRIILPSHKLLSMGSQDLNNP